MATIKEIFNKLNISTPTVCYKVVDGWVYRKYNHEKRFSAHMRKDLFIEDYEDSIRELNAKKNAHLVFKFLEENNIIAYYKSIFGSRYYIINGKSVRVSNHHYTSEKHEECSFNFCSYEENGYKGIIEELQSL